MKVIPQGFPLKVNPIADIQIPQKWRQSYENNKEHYTSNPRAAEAYKKVFEQALLARYESLRSIDNNIARQHSSPIDAEILIPEFQDLLKSINKTIKHLAYLEIDQALQSLTQNAGKMHSILFSAYARNDLLRFLQSNIDLLKG